MGATTVVPSKFNRKQQRIYDKELYRKRNRIERCSSKLKHFRRFATRYEKLKQNFKALGAVAFELVGGTVVDRVAGSFVVVLLLPVCLFLADVVKRSEQAVLRHSSRSLPWKLST